MIESESKSLHIELWQWLYDHPSKRKSDWPGWKGNVGDAKQWRCFACAVAAMSSHRGWADCEICPLNQEIMVGCSIIKAGAYRRWVEAGVYKDMKSRKKYAAIIRDAWREVP
jgi:hypothetical protein